MSAGARRLAPLNLPLIVNGNALALPIADGTVSLVVTSPPYWALRVYEDAGEVYDGQIGSEPDPVLFLRNLWASMDEVWRTLRADGVAWVNLGDKYAGSGGHNNASLDGRRSQTEARARTRDGERDVPAASYQRDGFRSAKAAHSRDAVRDAIEAPTATRASRARAGKRDRASTASRRNAPDYYAKGTEWARAKSLMALPWAFVLGLLNPTLYRDHLDPPADGECPTCEGQRYDVTYRGSPADDGGPDRCPTCDGDGVVAGEHPQWIYRAEQVWDKPNGLPESVDDRPRRSHEVWLMVTKNGDHYAALDEVREPYDPNAHAAGPDGAMHRPGPMAATWGLKGSQSIPTGSAGRTAPHPLGKLPGSVWRIASEPFVDVLYHVDTLGGQVMRADELWEWVRVRHRDGDTSPVLVREAEHFAPFPSEWPRRLVLGWSPASICNTCDEGRVPVITKQVEVIRDTYRVKNAGKIDAGTGNRPTSASGHNASERWVGRDHAEIVGHACACTPTEGEGRDRRHVLDGWTPPPSRPSVVLDMFGGTGTTALVAAALDRVAINVDLSWDYCRLAEWRTSSPKQRAKVRSRTLADRSPTLPL